MLLFLILILVLIFATTMRTEGFISYARDSAKLAEVSLLAYDNTSSGKVVKLYDDLFYDSRNGNVVVVEETGASISKINIIPRDNTANTVSYTKGAGKTDFTQLSEESKARTVQSKYGAYTTNGSTASLIYSAWGESTHMYVLDVQGNSSAQGNTSVVPVLTVSYSGNRRNGYNTSFGNFSIPVTASYTASSDAKNKTMVELATNTRKMYQIVPTVFYDVSNGNLIVKTAEATTTPARAATYNIYERGESSKSSKTLAQATAMPELSVFEEQPAFIADTLGKNTIVYHPLMEYTQVLVLGNTVDSSNKLRVVARALFDKNGVYTPITTTDTTTTTTTAPDTTQTTDQKPIGDNELLDAFSKWYMYFYGSDLTDYSDKSKYLLKTQVVPPVCPACPGCSGQGVCTDCGGNGGSGTKDGSSSLAFSDGKTVVGATGNAISNTVGATGNVLSNTVGATGDVLSKAVGTTGDVVNKTVDTAGNVVTGVVGKTLDTAGNVVGKTFDTAGNILGSAGHALGLDRVGYSQSYGGPVNTSSSANAQGYGYNRNYTGVASLPNGNPQDPYSYNGKLQSKGANFIPVTADFSRFGR